MDNENTISTLEHNRLWQEVEAANKKVRLELSVYRGSMSLSIVDSDKGFQPIFKVALPIKVAHLLSGVMVSLKSAAPGTKHTLQMTEWDPNAKAVKNTGSITLGIDEKGSPFVGVQSGAGAFKFSLRPDLKFDISGADIPRPVITAALIDAFAAALTHVGPVAQRVSSFKRPPMNGGGNRGGGGGNYGGGNRGGGGGNYGGGNRGGGAPAAELDDELPY